MLNALKKLFGIKATEPTSPAPYKIEAAAKSAADVNNDGKVNLEDAKAVVNKAANQVAKSAQQVAKGAKVVAKKTAPAKPRKPRTPKV